MCLFFKQKTAYEMRISDCRSDVCSSELDRLWPLRPRLVDAFAAIVLEPVFERQHQRHECDRPQEQTRKRRRRRVLGKRSRDIGKLRRVPPEKGTDAQENQRKTEIGRAHV